MLNFIHIWDFPEDKVYVTLDDDFRRKFFLRVANKLGGQRKLSRRLGIFYGTTWKMIQGVRFRSKEKRRETVRIKLALLRRICRIYSGTMGTNENQLLQQVEKNIKSYSAPSGAAVFNPILPIKRNPKIFRIIGHIIGDGTWVERCSPYFINSDQKLRSRFIKDLKEVFGDVEAKEAFYNDRVPIVRFPVVIVYVLMHIYGAKFSGIVGKPPFLDRLNRLEKAHFLQALYDDEGYVSDSNIQICSRDTKLLKSLKHVLLEDFQIGTSPIARYLDYKKVDGSISKVYYFNIYSRYVEDFSRYIGFEHSEKSLDLQCMLKRKLRKGIPSASEIGNIVIKELKTKGAMSAPELSRKVLITARNLRKYLRRMEMEGLIENAGKRRGKGGPLLWKLEKN